MSQEQIFREHLASRESLRKLLDSEVFKEAKQIVIEAQQPASTVVSCPNSAAGMYHVLAGINMAFDRLEELTASPPKEPETLEPYEEYTLNNNH